MSLAKKDNRNLNIHRQVKNENSSKEGLENIMEYL